MAAQELGQRMDDDIGAVVDRAQQDRRRDGVVDDQRHAVPMPTSASASMSQMLPAGLPMLSQKTARVLSSISFSIASAASLVGEADRDALARQDMREQRVRRAVELRHRDDVAAQVGEVDDRVIERRLTGARASAPTPPSSSAMRRSSTAVVGLLMRL